MLTIINIDSGYMSVYIEFFQLFFVFENILRGRHLEGQFFLVQVQFLCPLFLVTFPKWSHTELQGRLEKSLFYGSLWAQLRFKDSVSNEEGEARYWGEIGVSASHTKLSSFLAHPKF